MLEKLNIQVHKGEKAKSADFNRMGERVDELIDLQHVKDAEFEKYKQNVEQSLASIGADIKQYVQELMTYDEFKALSPKLFKYYFVAQNEEDKARMRCWRIYLGKQLVGIFNVDGSVSLPRFPFRFPVRL